MRAQRIRGAVFEWPEAEYGLYNFQRPRWLEQAVDHITAGRAPRVIVLAGEEAIGRSYFCDAVRFRIGKQHGETPAVWHLDLEGFEPDGEDPLARYLLHLLEDEERRTQEQRHKTFNALRTLARTLSKADWSAAILSFLWQFEDPLERFGEVLATSAGVHAGAGRSEREMLQMMLDELTRERQLLLHVTDSTQIRHTYRRWLTSQAVRNRNLVLAISCHPGEATGDLVPLNLLPDDPLRFDFEPLDRRHLREALEPRFAPGQCPEELVEALLRYSGGLPARVALKVLDLVKLGVLSDMPSDGDAIEWHLADGGLASQALARGFAADFYAPIEELIDGMPRLGRELREFLLLAALCGRNVPAPLLFAKLELSDEEADELTDAIDDHLVDELGLFWDLGQRHPAFPDIFVYQFRDPIMPGVILEQVDSIDREMEAASLMPFLRDRLHVRRREVARLFLSVAGHLGAREQKVYRKQLEWWIGTDEAEQLKPMVQEEIESGALRPDLVWAFLEASDDWPAYRRLALLDAYIDAQGSDSEPHVFSYERALQVQLLRGRLLLDLGRYPESLDEARAILQIVETQTIEECQGLLLAGMSLREMGEYAASARDLNRALLVCRELLGNRHLLTASVMDALAGTFRLQGELVESRELRESALAVFRHVLGEEHPNTLTALANLAATLYAQGDFASARQHLEEVLEASRRLLGAEHPETVTALANLAEMLRAQGDFVGAREREEEVLEARHRLLGAKHPETVTALANLAKTLRAQGDLAGAWEREEEVLEARRRLLGAEHPNTLKALANLATTLYAQGDFAGARQREQEILKARRRLLGAEHPDTLTALANLAKTLRAQGDLAGALQREEEVLEASRRLLGAEHPDTLTALANLAGTLYAQGDLVGARQREEEVLEASRRVLDVEHPDTLTAMHNLCLLQEAMEGAEVDPQLLRQLLSGIEKLPEKTPIRVAARAHWLKE